MGTDNALKNKGLILANLSGTKSEKFQLGFTLVLIMVLYANCRMLFLQLC